MRERVCKRECVRERVCVRESVRIGERESVLRMIPKARGKVGDYQRAKYSESEEQERMKRRKSAMERGGAFMCARACVYTLYRKRERDRQGEKKCERLSQ